MAGVIHSNGGEACSHGFALLEISIPFAPTLTDAAAVSYSFVPWVGSVLLFVVALDRKREVYAARLVALLLTSMIVINELVLKKVLQEPRPERSCLRSHGMPSSHALLAIGVLSYVALELLWGDQSLNGFRARSKTDAATLFCGLLVILGPVPFSRVHLHDHHESQVAMGSALGVLLAAVFFSTHRFWAKRKRRRNRRKAT